MPQQINLSTPVLLAQKRYFSAQTMLVSLAVFGLLGAGGTAYGLWELRSVTQAMRTALASQEPELLRLRASVALSKVSDTGGEAVAAQKLQAARLQLAQRTRALAEVREGLLVPGRGHSARLQVVAQSIPPQAWVTGVLADATQMEVSGFTLEPAVLNDWVDKLAKSPVMSGQQLSRVKVERATAAPDGRPLWSFRLVSSTLRPAEANK
jgi:Tfp pilus assembly protein PilN